MSSLISTALKSVTWGGNVDYFCDLHSIASRVEACNMKVAVWSKQLEVIDRNNPAIAFIREMQRGGHDVACAVSLALYKPAASAMRSLLECALYYAYFRTHPSELHTLVRDPKYYVSKKEIIAYFVKHIESFNERQSALAYLDKLELWYSKTSAIVHGQIPGVWSVSADLRDISHDDSLLGEVVAHFEEAVRLMQNTFLCSIAQDMWRFIESDAKEQIIKGLPGPVKTTLGLDFG